MKSFDQIRNLAVERKGGEASLQSLLGAAPSNATVASLTDDRILSAMAERIFSAGFVWRVIRQKWPGFEEAFLGFEPKTLLFQPEEFWQDLASDKRIVRNAQKIKAVRENAAMVDRVSSEHDGFGRFLAGWPKDDQIGLLAFLNKNGSRMGGATGQYFLRWIGWDSFILSRDTVSALQWAGLEIAAAPTSKKDLQQIQQVFNRWAGETGLSYTHMSRILAMSSGDNYDADTLRNRISGGDD